MKTALIAPAAVVLLLCAGCFTREETIVIHPDGSASVTYQVEGDRAEMETGDAIPTAIGWKFTQKEEVERSGEKKLTTTWTKELADLNDYPRTFAGPQDPHASAALHMTTRLSIEERTGRTIYRFERTYVGRRAGKFRELQSLAVPQELLDKAENDEASLTPEEREKVFTGLAEYEAMAMLLRARDGLGRATEAGVLDVATYGATVAGLETWLEERLTGEYLQRFFMMPEEEQAREEQALKDAFRDEAEQRIAPRERQRVGFYLDEEEKAFEVTQDLNDEAFELTVRMPGTVVYANTWETDGGKASWSFQGEDLTEGDRILTAVSVVEHDAAAR